MVPSNQYEDYPIANTTFIAPANGWYYGDMTSSGNGHCHIDFTNNANGMKVRSQVSNLPDSGLRCIIPVKKGQSITFSFTNAKTTSQSYLRFIYADEQPN